MFKPFRYFGDTRRPSQGFYNIMNYLRDELVAVGTQDIEFEFSATEMKNMYRPSLEITVTDKDGEISINSLGVLGRKLIIRLERRCNEKGHIKAKWEERYLYDS